MKTPLLPLLELLLALAFALPARAEDFYFNTTQGRLEQLNGLTATIHGVGTGAMGLDGNVGCSLSPARSISSRVIACFSAGRARCGST